MSIKHNYVDGFAYSNVTGKFVLNRNNLRQLDPEMYEAAGEFLSDKMEDFSCDAINEASDWDGIYNDAWRSGFGPISGITHPFWNHGLSDEGQRQRNIARQARMTSLALMATLIRDAKASRGQKKRKASHG